MEEKNKRKFEEPVISKEAGKKEVGGELTNEDEVNIRTHLHSLKGLITDSVHHSGLREKLLRSITKAEEEFEKKEFGPNLQFWLKQDSPVIVELKKSRDLLEEWLWRRPSEVLKKIIEKEMSRIKKKVDEGLTKQIELWNKLKEREKKLKKE